MTAAPATLGRPAAPAGLPRRPRWRTWLIGRPLSTADAAHEAIGKRVGLAVFASDALSSTAYATQEILTVLAAGGVAAFAYSMPIAAAIVVLLAVVTISYEQIIHAYPNGGGAYIVARDNLGTRPAQVAAAALLTDYILTVSVSISSGVAQLASAYPALFEHRVAIAVVMVVVIMIVNLRGVRESGMVFAVPSYFFIFMMYGTLGVGLVRTFLGRLSPVPDPPPLHMGEAHAIGAFLILHAFSNGTTALTGTEAISNGITAFREPRSRNAGVTLLWMAAILASMFLGITFLAGAVHAIPSEAETVISQIGRAAFGGRNVLYLMLIGATTLILVMAANTAYNGFPRLSALLAGDGYLPRQLTYRGSRLVFSRGIMALAAIAALLIVAFEASVTQLIPLYAIGVFLSFTLAQAGMTKRWRTVRTPGWRLKMFTNAFGALMTAAVTIIFAVTKFTEGAWVVLIIIPVLVALFHAIHAHYRDLAGQLSLDDYGAPPRVLRHRVVLPISGVHRGTVAALRYALALSDDITAVYVTTDAEKTARITERWGLWGNGVRLVVIDSPYRTLLEPLLDYVERIADQRQSNETLTIVVPQFVPRRWWHQLLHAQTAVMLRLALLWRPGVVITSVPYHTAAADADDLEMRE
ncbi:MAG TPA: APC family permease [Vicinamibacteria bacterium]|nr:APC family permease [Vicinamibacteria bacterium]